MYNSCQTDFDLLTDYIYAKIVIVPTMGLDFFGHYDEMTLVVQPAQQNPKQFLYCRDVSFGHSAPPNYEGLVCLIDKVVQSNWVVI